MFVNHRKWSTAVAGLTVGLSVLLGIADEHLFPHDGLFFSKIMIEFGMLHSRPPIIQLRHVQCEKFDGCTVRGGDLHEVQ